MNAPIDPTQDIPPPACQPSASELAQTSRPDGLHPPSPQAVHLPGLDAATLPWTTLSFGTGDRPLEVRVPQLAASHLETLASHVRAAAQARLAPMPVLEIVDLIDRCMARMLDRHSPQRQAIERQLAVVSGFDPDMLQQGLNASLKAFRRPQLLRFLAEDFGDPGLLDDFRPRPKGGFVHARGPALLGLAWAGNVPALPLWSLVAGLLVKAGCIGKVSSDEPLFAGWFARTLAQEAPHLADVLAVAWWPGGDTALEHALAREADVLMAYGGDDALAAWQRQVPVTTRFLPHGHKISAALVAAEALDARQSQATARQAALDVVRWDQQGCYSPQAFYVARGAQVSPREFAGQLAGELAALDHTHPRRALALEDAAAVARWRQAMAMAALQDPDITLLGAAQAPWSVAYLDRAQAPPPCALNRCISVIAVDRLEDAASWLAVRRSHLQTIGLAAGPETLFRLAPLLARAGATRLCALGAMTMPESGWHHDGRFSLLDLVTMVDLETSAEQAAEACAAYRD